MCLHVPQVYPLSQKSALGVLLNHYPSCILRQGFSLNLEFTDITRPQGQSAQRIYLAPPLRNWDYKHACTTVPSIVNVGSGNQGQALILGWQVFLSQLEIPSYMLLIQESV